MPAGPGSTVQWRVQVLERIVIRGGQRLAGAVTISGAKNAALPILAATVLTDEPCTVERVPRLTDTAVMMEILSRLGVAIQRQAVDATAWTVSCQAATLRSTEVPEDLMRRMRASIQMMGPLLARCGRAVISRPGGCSIGPRPIDLHLEGLQALGADIEDHADYISLRAPAGLRGAAIDLAYPSVGATENLMTAAALAQGETAISGAAREPEIADLARFLTGMGARIEGAGTDTVRVQGVPRLQGGRHRTMSDRIEAGTFALAAAVSGGHVRLLGADPDAMRSVLTKLVELGCELQLDARGINVMGPERLQAVQLATLPHPGFPTDLQNPMMAALCFAQGTSIITENVFTNRFKVVNELRRMGAEIQVDGPRAVVRGVQGLTGADVQAVEDLRGGAALVLAGLGAQGVSRVHGVRHLDRGYSCLEAKLQSLGGTVQRYEGDAG